jgi:hypothetical protein
MKTVRIRVVKFCQKEVTILTKSEVSKLNVDKDNLIFPNYHLNCQGSRSIARFGNYRQYELSNLSQKENTFL